MSRTRPIGASTPPKKSQSHPLPSLLEIIISKYGPTLNAEQARQVLHIGHSYLNAATASGRLKCRKVAGHRLFSAIEIYKYLEKQKGD